jgi:hypothetical protein
MDTGLVAWLVTALDPRNSFMKLCVTDAIGKFPASGSIDFLNINIYRGLGCRTGENSTAW